MATHDALVGMDISICNSALQCIHQEYIDAYRIYAMDVPKRVHTGIDRWKMEQITNLYDGGHTLQDIANQVDLEDHIVKEVIELAKRQKSQSMRMAA